MSTPLGLSVGRLLQVLFPPLPDLVGRQVVAVHNSRDFIFFRRFRYQFSLREDELSIERAKERGMDIKFRAKMQEIGPRMTLKLRWIKMGTLEADRRRANGQVIGLDKDDAKVEIQDEDLREDGDGPAVIEDAAAQQLAKAFPSFPSEQSQHDIPIEATRDSQSLESFEPEPTEDQDRDQEQTDNIMECSTVKVPLMDPTKKKRKRHATTLDASGNIKIPKLSTDSTPLQQDLTAMQNHRRPKPRKGASILDSVNLQGGTREESKVWSWNPKMQTKKNRFFL